MQTVSKLTTPGALISRQGATPEDFTTFIRQFSSDRNFQVSRIRFPLVWKEITNHETIVHRESAATWQHHDVLSATASNLSLSMKKPTTQKPNEAAVFITCRLACGFTDQLLFKRIGGQWYCVFREVMNG